MVVHPVQIVSHRWQVEEVIRHNATWVFMSDEFNAVTEQFYNMWRQWGYAGDYSPGIFRHTFVRYNPSPEPVYYLVDFNRWEQTNLRTQEVKRIRKIRYTVEEGHGDARPT